MAFSLHLFTASQASTTAMTNIAAAADPVASVNGNFLYVPVLNNLIGAYSLGADNVRAQLQSPTLLANVPYDITPVDQNALPSTPLPILLHPADPIKLTTDEPLSALVSQNGTAQVGVYVFLADGALAKVSGEIFRVRATVSTGTTADAWVNAAMTLTNQLAEGNYNLVGCRAECVNAKAVRFVFPGGTNATRPGCPVSTSVTKPGERLFRNGELGVWGTFSNRVLPTVDYVGNGTADTIVLTLDLIKA